MLRDILLFLYNHKTESYHMLKLDDAEEASEVVRSYRRDARILNSCDSRVVRSSGDFTFAESSAHCLYVYTFMRNNQVVI